MGQYQLQPFDCCVVEHLVDPHRILQDSRSDRLESVLVDELHGSLNRLVPTCHLFDESDDGHSLCDVALHSCKLRRHVVASFLRVNEREDVFEEVSEVRENWDVQSESVPPKDTEFELRVLVQLGCACG